MLGLLKTRSLQTSVLAALLFYVFANPGMYKIIRKIPGLKFVMKGATEITHQGTLVNALLFALIFLLCVYIINSHLIKDHLKFINIVEYMTEHGNGDSSDSAAAEGPKEMDTYDSYNDDRLTHSAATWQAARQALAQPSHLIHPIAVMDAAALEAEVTMVAGWVPKEDKRGRTYYENEVTGARQSRPPTTGRIPSARPPGARNPHAPGGLPAKGWDEPVPTSKKLVGGGGKLSGGGGMMGGGAAPEPEPSMAHPHHTTKGWKMPPRQVKLSSHQAHTQQQSPGLWEGSLLDPVHTRVEGSVERLYEI